MEKEFVPYELALRMKQLGFDEPCLGYYFGKDRKVYISNDEHVMAPFNPNLDSKVMFRAPTFSQAFRWFREKYNIHSFIIPLIDEVGFVYKYQARVHTKESAVEIIGEFETHEEAELACLEKLIELTFKSE
jgi:hypothetical protein